MKKTDLVKIAGRYPKLAEGRDEDQISIGRCPDLFDGGVHGKDEAEVYAKLVAVTLEWVEILHGEGTTLPKSRMSKAYREVHRARLCTGPGTGRLPGCQVRTNNVSIEKW
jgi:predicted RNase H-like HicB family nuclease